MNKLEQAQSAQRSKILKFKILSLYVLKAVMHENFILNSNFVINTFFPNPTCPQT